VEFLSTELHSLGSFSPRTTVYKGNGESVQCCLCEKLYVFKVGLS